MYIHALGVDPDYLPCTNAVRNKTSALLPKVTIKYLDGHFSYLLFSQNLKLNSGKIEICKKSS